MVLLRGGIHFPLEKLKNARFSLSWPSLVTRVWACGPGSPTRGAGVRHCWGLAVAWAFRGSRECPFLVEERVADLNFCTSMVVELAVAHMEVPFGAMPQTV